MSFKDEAYSALYYENKVMSDDISSDVLPAQT